MPRIQPLVVAGAVAAALPAQQFAASPNAHVEAHEVRGASSYQGVALDLDRDGDQDFAVADGTLLRNDGTGLLHAVAPGQALPGMGVNARLAAGDVDGDGVVDLVRFEGRFALFHRVARGGGLLPTIAITTSATGTSTSQTLLLDVDGDGDLDVYYGGLHRQLSLTNWSLTQVPALANANFMAGGDVDGDGDDDIVFLNNYPGMARSDGNGTFTDVTASAFPGPVTPSFFVRAELADMDGDGDLDLLALRETSTGDLYLNDGSGVFRHDASRPLPRVHPDLMAVLDLDADGASELVLGYDPAVPARRGSLWRNDGTGRLRLELTSTVFGGRPAPIDVDGDGDPDVLSDAQLLAWNDGGSRMARGAVALPHRPLRPIFGDFDGDGDADLLASGDRMLWNDGDGRFLVAPPTAHPDSGQFLWTAGLGDLDGDGIDDALMALTSTVELWLGDGRGGFRRAPSTHLPPGLTAVRRIRVGDADGDGDLDAVLVGGTFFDRATPFTLLTNDGTSRFTRSPIPAAPQFNADLTAFADLDGDGDLDLLVGGPRALLNDGSGNFTSLGSAAPVFQRTERAGDMDGDGDLDCVLVAGVSTVSYRPEIWWNDGSGRFGNPTALQPSGGMLVDFGLELLDFDDDGDLDVGVNTTDASGALRNEPLLNDGSGRFSPGPPGHHTARTLAGTQVDVDGDGDLDFVAEEVILNRDVQLSAPQVARLGAEYPLVFHWKPGYGPTSGVFALAWLGLATLPNPAPLPSGSGLLRVDPGASLVFPLVQLDAQGTATHVHRVPDVPALGGLEIYCQALFAPSANPAEWRLSGIVRDAVLR